MNRKYKIVIFGATGFTGELCARFMSERYSDIPIAIAGRSAEKLEKIKKTNNLPFPAIVADAFDVDALNKMCKDAEVVLSTAGPYHKYGSNLFSNNENRYFLHNAFAFYKKQILIDNPFDETLSTKEDRYWVNDMIERGGKSYYNSNTMCHHHYTDNGATWKGIG